MTFSSVETIDPWRDRALARSLEPARARSADRLERLVVAARDLANETGSAAFTVAQVASRAELSLKGFYAYFASKDDLLVALLEEDSRLGAGLLRDFVDAHDDPRARVEAYVNGVFELITLPGALGYAGVLLRENRRLAESRPDELGRALAPMIAVLETELVRGVATGAFGSADPTRDARLVFALVLDAVYEVVLGRADAMEQAASIWRFCWGGVRGAPPDQPLQPATTEERR
jgi:AcrR family transcriptional regulator